MAFGFAGNLRQNILLVLEIRKMSRLDSNAMTIAKCILDTIFPVLLLHVFLQSELGSDLVHFSEKMNLFRIFVCFYLMQPIFGCNENSESCITCITKKCVFVVKEGDPNGYCVTALQSKQTDNLKLKARTLVQCSLTNRILTGKFSN